MVRACRGEAWLCVCNAGQAECRATRRKSATEAWPPMPAEHGLPCEASQALHVKASSRRGVGSSAWGPRGEKQLSVL